MQLSTYTHFFEHIDCDLYYNKDENIIYQEWKSTAYGEPYRNILLEILVIQREHHINKLIVNGKELGELDEDDINWTQNEYTPLSVQEGLKYIAFIVSDDAYHAMQQADVIYEAENNGVVSKHFNSRDDAYAWIKSK